MTDNETNRKVRIIKRNSNGFASRHYDDSNFNDQDQDDKGVIQETIGRRNLERLEGKRDFDNRVVNDLKITTSVSIRTSTKILLLEVCKQFKTKKQSSLIEKILLRYMIPLLESKGVDWIDLLDQYDLYDPEIFDEYTK